MLRGSPFRRSARTCSAGIGRWRNGRARGPDMRLTVVGSGDAFGSGGHFNTCFWLETAEGTLLIDCGASTPVALQIRGLDFGRVDGVVLSHLHGDHFGGLPFHLLDAQFVSKRQ